MNPELGSHKVKGRQISSYIILILCIILISVFSLKDAQAELTVRANHDNIKIDFLYHGSTLSIRGVSDQGTDLILTIASPEGHQAFKKKGKVGGLLWMNIGQLKLEKVPNFYAVHSSGKLEDILCAADTDKYVIGYPALLRHAEISPASGEAEKAKWFAEFVKFKESSRLFSTSSGNISRTVEGGKQNYYILTEWPYQAPPGKYLVTVYAVKDKRIVEKAEAPVIVEQAGIVKTLSGMARNNAAVYGILSIVAAIAAGFGVGLVFRKGGGAH